MITTVALSRNRKDFSTEVVKLRPSDFSLRHEGRQPKLFPKYTGDSTIMFSATVNVETIMANSFTTECPIVFDTAHVEPHDVPIFLMIIRVRLIAYCALISRSTSARLAETGSPSAG